MPLNLQRVVDLPEDQPQPPAPGHNSGNIIDWAEVLDLDVIRMTLDVEYGHLQEKHDKLMKAYNRLVEDYKDGVRTDDDVAKLNDIGGQMKTVAKLIESTREIVKGPFFKADRAVQNFFRSLGEPLEKGAKAFETLINAYNIAKAAEAQRLAAEEAKQRREEADRLAATATTTMNSDLLDEAVIAEEAAAKAERTASGPTAAFTRVRGDFAMSSSTKRYTYKITNFALVPDEYKEIVDSKVKRAINGKDRLTEIPGLEIVEELKTTIRI